MSKIFLAKIGASLMAIMLITACGNQDDDKKDESKTEQSSTDQGSSDDSSQ
ncbi:hypothetical protein [Bacillus sp. NEB1478]|uniref:hypothetical protein n=1 Tax=Bacillus sp. NEB1478 TaxID=3073816 RepID=UPI0028736607|nr:hypothetical protein [Bacillus sp. NEB1478]WNB92367.1 hypothetical protein RGB74_01505 [Bacillus sp. NEB1478]